ncbi:DUF378 domain-containing protein [Rhabdochlamydiaceae symbiont of Dictyostelium giganteum]|uniref:DUF378 domain-containing protein n=1 Tax=Rhabdochlamydiaceae symbiont of Dictyostelium giganteum TaxID=3342349 RepID=UPI00384D93A6
MKKMISILSMILIVVGALNWGLWGFFQFDLVAWLANGNTTTCARIIYGAVGLAGLWGLGRLGKIRALCDCCSDARCSTGSCCCTTCGCTTGCGCCSDAKCSTESSHCKDGKCKSDKNNIKSCK